MQESDTVNQNEATKVLEKKAEKPNITPIQPPPKELDEKQKYALKSAYKSPNDPTTLVHPHTKAKSVRFDCTVMSPKAKKRPVRGQIADFKPAEERTETSESKIVELEEELRVVDNNCDTCGKVLKVRNLTKVLMCS